MISADYVSRLREASEWSLRLNSLSDDGATIEAWYAWCAADSRNIEAFERMQELWEGFETAPVTTASPSPRFFARHWTWSAAAACVLIALALWSWPNVMWPNHHSFRTSVGEQRREILADGSRLDLGADSQVAVQFSDARREIRLEKGDAFFSVAHNAARPFVVHAGGLQVIAVGTEFEVRVRALNTVVTVKEGRVRVTSDGGGIGSNAGAEVMPIQAIEGQRVTYTIPANSFVIASVNPRTVESWRDGVLQFTATPLADVVEEVDRYTSRKIMIADSGVKSLLFTGTVTELGVDDWLKALETIFPITLVKSPSGETVIERRAKI
jgi:transmembrane sensor